jgi:superfamily II DNA or RNA helicase
MRSLVNFIIDENVLTVYPAHPQMFKWLSYWERRMEKTKRGSKTVEVKKDLFWLDENNPQVLKTYQGLWKFLANKCLAEGMLPQINDVRATFPEPQLKLMRGLYPIQHKFVVDGLSVGWSGIFSAPTRFGKSYCMAAIIQAFPHMKTVVLVPGEDLGEQLYDDLADLLGYKLVMLGCGSKHHVQGERVTVCSMDSMHKLDHAGTKLVLIDEVHTLVTDNRLEQYLKLNMARKYGFGATAAGRYDRRDLLTEAVIGPILAEVTFREAVEADVIAPIEVFMLVVPYDTDRVSSDRQRAYKQMLWESNYIGNLVQAMCSRVLPPNWQTLLFIEEEKSAEFFGAKLPGSFISMAKRLTKKQRRAAKHQMVRGEIAYCLASRIYSQGVTFPDLRVVINLTGGGANTYAVQKPGRVAQKRPGKRCGVLVDFLFRGTGDGKDGSWAPHREAHARLKLYQERGYQVNVIEDLSTFPEVFREKCV